MSGCSTLLGRVMGALAMLGLVCSMLAHLASFAGWQVSEHAFALFAMHGAAMLSVVAAALRAAYGELAGTKATLFAGRRPGTRLLAALVSIYAIGSIAWGAAALEGHVSGPGDEAMASRVFSATWMWMFAFVALLFWPRASSAP